MKARAGTFAGQLLLLMASASMAIAAPAPTGSSKLRWALHLNETRGPIRTPDVSALPDGTAASEVLGGPTNGSDNAYLIFTRMAAGAHGPALFTLPVEDDYVVISGKLTVRIGTDKFVAGPLTAVVIPANTPHNVWNGGAEPEAHLEVIASANPSVDLSRNIMSMLKPAQPIRVENAAKGIRKIKVPGPTDLKPGLNRETYTNRAMGSPITAGLDSTSPGSGGPKSHVHRFEQVYFMVDGETTIKYGLDNAKAKKNDIVIIPPGVVHTNKNQSNTIERHITLLLPEPAQRPFDIEFDEKCPAEANNGPAAAPIK
jgi:mannose-6-phosphate isomerase-like protein (cupin superfamily)